MRVPIHIVKDPIGRSSRSDIETRGEEVLYKEARCVLLPNICHFLPLQTRRRFYSFGFNKDIERFTVLVHYL